MTVRAAQPGFRMFNPPTTSVCRRPALRGLPCASEPFALEASELTVVRGRKVVFRHVNVAVSSGEMVALQGANGAGKTTLLHCLAGALQPTEGAIRWFGKTLDGAATRAQVGFLGHESGLYLALTAWENLLFAGRMCGLDRVAERAERLLQTLGLHQHQRQQAGCLSRGMKQRLAIARAVIHDPPILLLDEPLTSLDSRSRDFLGEFLHQRRGNGCAILVASHEVEKGMFDRVMVLQEGSLQAMAEHHLSDDWRS